jgi:photosystem II stability/assembly factor-like uncharacterized protein
MRRMRSFLSLILMAAAVLLAPRSAAFGQPPPNRWIPFGPGGGSVKSIAVDPRDPAVVYAIGSADFYNLYGSLFKSTDGGATWKARVLAQVMALDPEHPSTIYAGGNNLLRSDDGGQTWTDLSPQPETQYGLHLQALAVAPGGVLLAADGPRLLRSADGGQTWAVVSQDVFDIRSILVDPADPRRAYSLSDRALYRSDDGGAHWTLAGQPGSAGASFYGAGFALAPSAPKTLYVLLPNDHIFRSDDGATTWRAVGTPPRTEFPVSLLVDPRSPGKLYTAGVGAPFTSTDGGRSWRKIDAGLPRLGNDQTLPVYSLALAPSRPETLFAGTQGWGVARSESSGTSWRTGDQAGFNAADVLGLQFHPQRPWTVYLFQDEGRTFHSTDDGRTWQPFARAFARNGLAGLAFDPADPNLLYASNSTGTWKSTNDGKSWVWLAAPQGELAALAPKILLGARCGLTRSTNGGRSWKVVVPCDTPDGEGSRIPRSLWVDPRTPGTAYVHFLLQGSSHPRGQEAFRSQDGGATWTRLALASPSSFAVAPSDSRILYAMDSGVLLRSVDGGGSWKVVNRSPPSGSNFYDEMVVGAADPNTLYIAANPLLISHDGGATFKEVDTPFEIGKRGVNRLWTDRNHPGLVYATAALGGLYVGRFE